MHYKKIILIIIDFNFKGLTHLNVKANLTCEQNLERINRTKPVLNFAIQLVIIILYTECELFIVNGCEKIFTINVKRKKKEEIQRRLNRRKRVLSPTSVPFCIILYLIWF